MLNKELEIFKKILAPILKVVENFFLNKGRLAYIIPKIWIIS
ncbi:LOW QUALITY PROTEIN: GlnD family protein [Campylobacter jejuni subsp. jejuni 414]|nr:LOW QUALITY PROTEIN: GlnD family protein [Campylobacter jejuni subsp. jejuni 414]